MSRGGRAAAVAAAEVPPVVAVAVATDKGGAIVFLARLGEKSGRAGGRGGKVHMGARAKRTRLRQPRGSDMQPQLVTWEHQERLADDVRLPTRKYVLSDYFIHTCIPIISDEIYFRSKMKIRTGNKLETIVSAGYCTQDRSAPSPGWTGRGGWPPPTTSSAATRSPSVADRQHGTGRWGVPGPLVSLWRPKRACSHSTQQGLRQASPGIAVRPPFFCTYVHPTDRLPQLAVTPPHLPSSHPR